MSGSSCLGYSGTSPVLAAHSFWPSFTAPAGHTSTHRPQATHLSVSVRATYAERDRFGVLNSCEARSA
ncbi:Uncharacterised protein [Collinsella intestinalis]|nr:Uncharacterised protein [Collinsella intestinalis]